MLDDLKVEENYKTFINLLETNVKRDGIELLIKWLNAKDTKIAPASTRYHLSYKGGLVEHCLNVYDRLKKLMKDEFGDKCPYSDETITLVSLMHDLSKVNFYEIQERNTKDESGNWIKVPFYQVKDEKDRLVFGGHAVNSYYMLSNFMKLSYEESLAIMHHMGGLDTTEDTITMRNIAEAFKKSTLALFLHQADLMATFMDERE